MDWMQVSHLHSFCIDAKHFCRNRGNILVVGSSTAVAIPLTWGGSQFAWNSLQVIVPLAVGVSGFIIFLIYEELWATDPIVCQLICMFPPIIADVRG